MADDYYIREITDEEYDRLTPDQQFGYNLDLCTRRELAWAKKEYDATMSIVGPASLAIIVSVTGFIISLLIDNILSIILMTFGICLAVLWAVIRVVSRSDAYKHLRDTETELKSSRG
ncbi:MAG: hypothetical protein M0R30_04365 [Methanoregula sp.]|jgi:hypothetical protein|uniref:hypothetical protein n=1 Tax=Methanoregula sp. TaxID=2052170 RepID=UPI0025EF6B53|nr:hypothetical protein [Methanoregula sp.]MCK9630853.1 hypothetical protein [Methanoregula sp.]